MDIQYHRHWAAYTGWLGTLESSDLNEIKARLGLEFNVSAVLPLMKKARTFYEKNKNLADQFYRYWVAVMR